MLFYTFGACAVEDNHSYMALNFDNYNKKFAGENS